MINVTLDSVQLQSCDWLFDHPNAILADERGIGKTGPAIIAAIRHSEGPNLVVCPAYLLTNWQVELEMWGAQDICVVAGTPQQKQVLLAQRHEWTVVSYETLVRREYFVLLFHKWETVIYDEAHHLRGRNSKRTKAAILLRPKCNRISMLTGTPLVADAGDLYPLLRLCNPRDFGSYWKFVERHCYITRNPWTTVVGKLKDEKEFYGLLSPYMLRRKLHEVRPEIPEHVEENIYVDVRSATRTQLTQVKNEYRYITAAGEEELLTSGGALIHTLRRLVAEDGEKIDTLVDLLDDLPKQPTVVFCWYQETAALIETVLGRSGWTVAHIVGGVPVNKRMEILQALSDGRVEIVVATLGAMQEGLNLQFCKQVVFVEGDWLYKTHTQAIGRFVRRGQDQTVHVYNIIARKTVDEVVYKTMKKRQGWNLKALLPEVLK